eukprot:Opistho-1_new@97183
MSAQWLGLGAPEWPDDADVDMAALGVGMRAGKGATFLDATTADALTVGDRRGKEKKSKANDGKSHGDARVGAEAQSGGSSKGMDGKQRGGKKGHKGAAKGVSELRKDGAKISFVKSSGLAEAADRSAQGAKKATKGVGARDRADVQRKDARGEGSAVQSHAHDAATESAKPKKRERKNSRGEEGKGADRKRKHEADGAVGEWADAQPAKRRKGERDADGESGDGDTRADSAREAPVGRTHDGAKKGQGRVSEKATKADVTTKLADAQKTGGVSGTAGNKKKRAAESDDAANARAKKSKGDAHVAARKQGVPEVQTQAPAKGGARGVVSDAARKLDG